ncbi:MAG TPA: BON domain-containing protein [Firmicutes bacterium]|nr:BON domain-containing protein [Bacillota bacterium]
MAGKKGGKTGRKGRQDERRLEESVRAAIARDPGMRGYEIGVKARGGEIVLTGVVDVLAEKERLREIAAAVPGVERVEADLTVSTDGAITERGVEMEAAEELAARPGLDPAEVGVKVEGGVAHLVGRVDGPEEERAARAAVAKARGVTEVQSHLKRGRKGNDPD